MKLKNSDTKIFFKHAINRAVRTMAQAMVASIGATAVITDINWAVVLGTTATTGLLSILNSIATGLPEVPEKTE